MKAKVSIIRYVRARTALINCRQNHFKQLCQRCKKWSTCKVYGDYVQAWMDLQGVVK